LKLLGRPDNYVAQASELSWNTGPERGWFGIDSEHLVAHLGEGRRVKSARLTTD